MRELDEKGRRDPEWLAEQHANHARAMQELGLDPSTVDMSKAPWVIEPQSDERAEP